MKSFLSILGLAIPFLVSAQTQTGYFPNLPDTVFPCRSYSEYHYGPIPKKAASSSFARPDTFELRLDGNIIPVIASSDSYFGGFELVLPCQAKSGAYSVYDPNGQMQPQRKIVVADPNSYGLDATSMIKKTDFLGLKIEEEPQIYGPKDILVGAVYPLLIESKALLFGALPATGTFKQEVDSIVLVGETETIPMTIDSIPNPFQAHGFVRIPFGLTPKPYNLVVKWKDGTRKVCSNLARIVTRKAPVVKEIKPETLVLGAITQLAITGDDLQYVNAGSFVSLDRASILNAYVKSGDQILPAYGFPNLSPSGRGFPEVSGIQAQFQVPKTFPTGPADLLIHVSGRNDTALFPKVLQVSDRPIMIGDVSPNMWGQTPLKLTAKVHSILPSGAVFKAALRKNATQILASQVSIAMDRSQVSAEFPIGPDTDTGFYSLDISNTLDVSLSLPNAVHIFPPQLAGPAILIQSGGKTASIPVSTRFPLVPILDTAARITASVCRNDQCIRLTSTGSVETKQDFKVSADLPADTETGLYDLKLEFSGLERPVLFPQSVVVHGKEQQVLVPKKVWPDTVTKVFFTYEVGGGYQWNYGTPCDQTLFIPIRFPVGASLKIVYATWTPALADTGMNRIEVQAPDSCGGKSHLHFANVVKPAQSTSLMQRPFKSQANRSAMVSPHLIRHGKGIHLDWSNPNPGRMQLFSLSGRLLASHSFASGEIRNGSWNLPIATGETVFFRWTESGQSGQSASAKPEAVVRVFRLRVP
jgi:hypothetical protein